MKANISFYYRCVRIFFKTLFRFVYNGKLYGLENVPKEGAFILACNHVSHLDPPLVAILCPRQPIFAFARSTLFKKGIAWFYYKLNMIPVDREKGNDVKSIKTIINVLNNGYPIIMFPEGTRSITGIPQRAKKGIGLFVSKTKVPVIPVRIFGTFEALPKGKRWLNFKPTIEIVYGKPIYADEFNDCKNDQDYLQAISDRIMQSICNIKISDYARKPINC